MDIASDTNHEIAIESGFADDNDWTARCLCGWQGPHRTIQQTAVDDAAGHYSNLTRGSHVSDDA